MRIHEIAFWFSSFFLFGVLLKSFDKISLSVLVFFVLAVSFIIFLFGYINKKRFLIFISVLFLAVNLGGFYYYFWNSFQKSKINIPIGEKIIFSGIISEYPQKGDQQKLIIKLSEPFSGRILINLNRYPEFDYGDLIEFDGLIKKPKSESYAKYLEKDSIFAVSDYPKSKLISKNNGLFFKAALFSLKENFVGNINKILSYEKAAFLSGITIGERAQFSKEFKEAMNNSGTSHLVALSGYNITILATAAFAFFGYMFSRRATFVFTLILIIGFVFMAGAEPSIVRAAIMGSIALLAEQIGRIKSMRNAIVLAALFMVLINPNVLRFDLGFQLSFAALMGIVYLSPAIKKFLKMKDEEGIFGWRKNFLNTTAAQLTVIPILVFNFGKLSVFGLIANILILEFMPLTMFIGFLAGSVGFASYHLSLVIGWFVNILLSYELWVIEFFGRFPALSVKAGIIFVAIFYFVLLLFVLHQKKTKQ